MKTQMYAAPAVKGLASSAQKLHFFFITIFHPFGRICCALGAINEWKTYMYIDSKFTGITYAKCEDPGINNIFHNL